MAKAKKVKQKVAVKPSKAKPKEKVIKSAKSRSFLPVKKKLKIAKAEVKATEGVLQKKIKIPGAKQENDGFEAEALFKARIKVIGIGGGGGSIVSEIGKSLKKATFLIADTDIRALKKRADIKYFWFGEDFTHGLGTGVNVDLAKQAADTVKERIKDFFKDQDIIIFIASLGGGLGSGATQVFAEAAKETGAITFGIFTLPFKFEGKNKYRIAQNSLKSLRNSLNVSLVIPNEKIFKVIDTSTPITTAFSTVNKSLIESLENLIDLIYNPGIINIDFADLRTVLKGRGNIAFLNTVEESGKNRAEKICEKALVNPLLQTNSFEAEKIMFNISGSENLSMFEVEKISSHISGLNPKAKIIFGISKNAKLKNKVRTTILMTGGQIKDFPEEKEQEPVKTKEAEKTEIVVAQNHPQQVKKTAPVKKAKKEIQKKAEKKKAAPAKKPVESEKKAEKVIANKEATGVSFTPSFEPVAPSAPIASQKKIDIIETAEFAKKTIRRSALDIKKAEEMQEKEKMDQEKEWEIPAFLRRVKFKS